MAMLMVSTAGCVISVWRRVFFRLGDGCWVSRIDKDEFGERLAQQRRHHAIGFGKGLGDDGLGLSRMPRSMFTYCEPWPV